MNIGDYVLYARTGVCKVMGTEKKIFDKTVAEFYVLAPVFNEKSKIFLPTAGSALNEKVRPIADEKCINELISSINSLNPLWDDNENERKNLYRDEIATGDREKLLRIIKTLTLHKKRQQTAGKKLHLADEKYLEEASKLLFDEMAFVLQKDKQEIADLVLSKIGE